MKKEGITFNKNSTYDIKRALKKINKILSDKDVNKLAVFFEYNFKINSINKGVRSRKNRK